MSSRFVGVGALAASALLASGCWLQTGFDAGRTGFNGGETAITSDTVAGLQAVWAASTGAPAEPLVFGSSVYVRTTGVVRALDAATGAGRWTATGLSGSRGMAVAGNRLWVPTPGGQCLLQALNRATGEVVEIQGVGGPDLSGIGGFSACGMLDPLAVGSKVVTTWSYIGSVTLPRECFPEPVNAAGGGLLAVDVDDQTARWTTGSLSTVCGPAIPPLPPAHGTGAALTSDGTSVLELFGTRLEAHAVDGGACDPAGCSTTLPIPAGGSFVETPTVAAGNRLVVVGTDGTLYAIDRSTNTLAWSASFATSASVPAAVTPTTVYVAGGAGELAAFPLAGCGAPTCPPAWTASLPGHATGRPTVGGDVLYAGTSDGTVAAFAAGGCGSATCGSLWSQDIGDAISASPVVDGGSLYAGTANGFLFAFRLP
jgi:outer membrane protein assembly factor BamB